MLLEHFSLQVKVQIREEEDSKMEANGQEISVGFAVG